MTPVLAPEAVLGFVTTAVGVLAVISLTLALVAIRLRLRNEARARQLAELEARWTPYLLEVLEGDADPETLHAQVSSRDRLDFVSFLLVFAQRVRGREWKLVQELALPYLDDIAAAARRRDAERRARAVQTLGELGMPDYAPVLVQALDDESDLVAMVAARRLFRPGNEAYFPAVLHKLDRFSLWSQRFVSGMLASGGVEAVPVLRTAIADDGRSAPERVAALDALRILHDSGAADQAHTLLSEGTDREVRIAALRLLEVVGHDGYGPEVRALLTHGDSPTRQAAAEALGALGDHSDAKTLADLLDDPSPWVRVGAARALSALGARQELLIAAASDGPEGQVAREVLGR